MSSSVTWQQEMLCSTILWLMVEHRKSVPLNTDDTPYASLEDEIQILFNNSFIDICGEKYIVTDRGKQVITNLVAMYDQTMRFQVFEAVDLCMEYPDDIADEDGNIFDDRYDPRLDSDSPDCEDLRLAMMETAVKAVNDEVDNKIALDPHKIVFLQKLVDGDITKGKPEEWLFNMKLGSVFTDIEEIVSSAYSWKDLGDDEEESWEIAQQIYTSGMIENRKREGNVCTKCDTPLGAFEAQLEDGEELDECPNCQADFRVTENVEEDCEYECPSCKSGIRAGQSTCFGCGAHVNFSLPAGTVTSETTETVEETTTVEDDYDDYGYGCYYGYTPYGYYDPFYPVADAMAFGLLCGAILY